jgi:hypothetical protein
MDRVYIVGQLKMFLHMPISWYKAVMYLWIKFVVWLGSVHPILPKTIFTFLFVYFVLRAGVCLSQNDSWLYPYPLTLKCQLDVQGRDFCAERKCFFVCCNIILGHLTLSPTGNFTYWQFIWLVTAQPFHIYHVHIHLILFPHSGIISWL